MWCPKCKNEYREGITVCADCGCELVPELTYAEAKESVPELIEEDDAIEMVTGESPSDEILEEMEDNKPAFKTSSYTPKRERYEDNRSSAWTFFIVGGAGLVAVILHIAGIIDFNLTEFSKILTNTVMGSLFLIFIVVGFVSVKSAKKYKKEAAEEEQLTETLTKRFYDEFTSETLDAACGADNAADSYRAWQLRYNYIMNSINDLNLDLLPEYVEYVTEMVYDKFYPAENPDQEF